MHYVKLKPHVEWNVISCMNNISVWLPSPGIKRLASLLDLSGNVLHNIEFYARLP